MAPESAQCTVELLAKTRNLLHTACVAPAFGDPRPLLRGLPLHFIENPPHLFFLY